ncbi:MAG TPA: DUF4438 domain-containing protein [Gaiellaceae bacterium]|nr:DUF4438 domain-containing protein [Gaiellaceae bacterium]
MSTATINESELLRTALVGDVTSPVLGGSPYDVSADGVPFVPVGAGGICYTVEVGMPAAGWAADQVEPGVSIANPSDPANEALLVYACVGNRVTVRSGAAAGATGVVTGKHEAFHAYKHVLVHLDKDALDAIVPGDRLVVSACGRGMQVDGLPELSCHSLSPDLWNAWAPQRRDAGLRVRVTRALPPEVVGMGSGRVSGSTSVALQPGPADLEHLRIGDLVAIHDWDASYYTGYHEGRMTVGLVSTGDSPVLGNGAATTILLSGPTSSFEFVEDGAANLADLLGLA